MRSAPSFPSPPTSSAPLSGAPLSSSLRHGVPASPPSTSLSPAFPPLAPPSATVPPPPGFPPLASSASLGSGSSLLVPGLGVGVPPPSGVPPYPVNSAAFAFPAPPHATAHATAPAPPPSSAAWPQVYPPASFAPSTPGAAADPYMDDDDDRIQGDVHDPPLALESARSEYRRMIDYICGLFPQAVGVPPFAPLPRALFESFFAPAAQASPSVQLNWFDRVRTSLLEADSHVASLLSSGHPERLVVPTCTPSYAVRGDWALGHAVPVNEPLLSHFERPLRPSLQLGITARDAMYLEASSRAQSEALLCHVGPFRVIGLRAPAGFYSRRSCFVQPACNSSFQEPCPSGSDIRLSYRLLMSSPPRVLLVSPPRLF